MDQIKDKHMRKEFKEKLALEFIDISIMQATILKQVREAEASGDAKKYDACGVRFMNLQEQLEQVMQIHAECDDPAIDIRFKKVDFSCKVGSIAKAFVQDVRSEFGGVRQHLEELLPAKEVMATIKLVKQYDKLPSGSSKAAIEAGLRPHFVNLGNAMIAREHEWAKEYNSDKPVKTETKKTRRSNERSFGGSVLDEILNEGRIFK